MSWRCRRSCVSANEDERRRYEPAAGATASISPPAVAARAVKEEPISARAAVVRPQTETPLLIPAPGLFRFRHIIVPARGQVYRINAESKQEFPAPKHKSLFGGSNVAPQLIDAQKLPQAELIMAQASIKFERKKRRLSSMLGRPRVLSSYDRSALADTRTYVRTAMLLRAG